MSTHVSLSTHLPRKSRIYQREVIRCRKSKDKTIHWRIEKEQKDTQYIKYAWCLIYDKLSYTRFVISPKKKGRRYQRRIIRCRKSKDNTIQWRKQKYKKTNNAPRNKILSMHDVFYMTNCRMHVTLSTRSKIIWVGTAYREDGSIWN